MASKRDPYIVVVKNFVVSDRPGRKYMEKMLNDGYEVVSETKTAFTRATTVTFRKPNPKYKG
ncbi:hypothetical protein [Microbacterium sp. YY-01]|uniref:hypothetical protein n=1 Tax=Microbacterium sp. YY-01 TaxID=3421634 RepID=UPI003D17CF02